MLTLDDRFRQRNVVCRGEELDWLRQLELGRFSGLKRRLSHSALNHSKSGIEAVYAID